MCGCTRLANGFGPRSVRVCLMWDLRVGRILERMIGLVTLLCLFVDGYCRVA